MRPIYMRLCAATAVGALVFSQISAVAAMPAAPAPEAEIKTSQVGFHGGGRPGGFHRPPGHGIGRPPHARPPAHVRPPVHAPGRPGHIGRPGYHGGYHGGYWGGWSRPHYGWRPGGAIAAGAALGFLSAAAAAAYATSAAPAAGLCWYYTDASRRAGFWDACP